jgi:hypothetical protein
MSTGQKLEMGFKNTTFNAAAAHIGPFLTQGPPKTEKQCKTKWTAVHHVAITENY